MKFETQMTN